MEQIVSKQPIEPYDRYLEHVDKAKKYVAEAKWEDAGNDFFEAAQVSEINLKQPHRASSYYMKSAECFRKTQSARAYESYRKSIKVYVEQGLIESAIDQSVRCGYIYEKEYGDTEKSSEFYDQADNLRSMCMIEHSCAFSNLEMNKLIQDISIKLEENVEVCLNNKQRVLEIIWDNYMLIAQTKSCRKCVHCRNVISKYVDELVKLDYQEKIDWVKKNHKTFKDELKQTLAYVEQLIDSSKNAAKHEPADLSGDA
ncbi:Alpha-soluble NSF attachment protein [Thelohanellus kitauei]|uniref:Alpha-soluble NSF attachment protein n=1 Tax=Thelohanellus kitauei TaxID=669202 RepID=A0A0C2MH37_THEKT|nr:Alpha-soluble NSF attachment protein [Thelohanellus kitauei]